MNLSKLESEFQKKLKNELESRFPGCIVTKLEPNDPQGIPDLVVFWGSNYALLECKRSAKAPKQPNQDYYVDMFNEWSYSSFVYPENKESVLNDLERTWKHARNGTTCTT